MSPAPKAAQAFALRYTDNDGDLVPCSTDEEVVGPLRRWCRVSRECICWLLYSPWTLPAPPCRRAFGIVRLAAFYSAYGVSWCSQRCHCLIPHDFGRARCDARQTEALRWRKEANAPVRLVVTLINAEQGEQRRRLWA